MKLKEKIALKIQNHINFVKSFKESEHAFHVEYIRKSKRYTSSAMHMEIQEHLDKTVARIIKCIERSV